MTQPPPGPDDHRIAALEATFLATYVDTQYHYVQFLTEHLADCARTFNGDLACVLVLAVLGQRRLALVRQDPAATALEPALFAMSAARIADVAGIPRETVRRKLLFCRQQGWIARDPRAGWYVCGGRDALPARLALADLEARSFRRLARLQLRLSEIVERPAGPAAGSPAGS